MRIKRLVFDLTVCKVKSEAELDLNNDFYFVCKTADEISVVCISESVPLNTTARVDGWKAFCVDDTLDFSLVGILSKITGVLAENGIGIFAVSTFNTDYILVKKEQFEQAANALKGAGYEIV